MLEACREIFSSGMGDGMAKKGREEVAISIILVVGAGLVWLEVAVVYM